MLAKGIDVSHFQGSINWPQVAGSGVVFCFVKARFQQAALESLTAARD